MARFVFRIQVALDLRVRQEEEARAALARAEQRRHEAEMRRDAARAALAEALVRAGEVERAHGAVTERQWHRNWIALKRREVMERQRDLDACVADVHAATARAREAHKQRRMLERLRDRAARRFQLAERRADQKTLDELGAVRHRRIQQGGDRP